MAMNSRPTDYLASIFRKIDDPRGTKEVMQFRHKLFNEHLGWKLNSIDNLESDNFDTEDTVYASISVDGVILGSFRAIRTDQPYLAQNIFSTLATTRPYPKRADMWEVSRFGILPNKANHEVAHRLYALMFQFGLMRRAKSLVAVTDLFHERYLSRHGIRTRRYGKPASYGTDQKGRPLLLVSGEIPLEKQNQIQLQKLLSTLNGVTINDQTLVFGCTRIQA
jgi:N-acyl-L-homoserine lactone synthetase